MASTELVKAGEESSFAVLKMDQQELRELIEENLGGDSLSVRDLDRVKVPAGGGTTWEVPTFEGEVHSKEIRGIVIHRATRRAYWPKKELSEDPPDCASNDGIEGVGEPGGACAECPFNEFQSGHDGISKACKEMRQLFILTEDSLIPIVVTIPPGSLANVKAYFLRLLRAQKKSTDVVTVLSLEKAKSKGGIDFARVVLNAGQQLEPEAAVAIREYAQAMQPAFQQAAIIRRDEVEEVVDADD